MRKLYRSVLLTSMVAVGLAGCGDDVTIVDPPAPPAPTVKSISVGPNPGTVQVGQTITMSAAVTADEGVATTVTWSSSDAAKATVNATTGVVTGVSAGSVAITATSTVNPAVQGVATVNVVAAPTSTVTGVTVTPANAALVVGQTVQLSASVQGTNNPAQTVTWSSLTPGVASVSAGGLVTALANGTAVVRGCSTVAGYTNVCGSMSVTVTTPTPASVSIQSLTTGNLGTPVVLTAVAGQIEATVNVESGDQQLDRVDVLFGGQVIASQSFAVSPAPAEEGAAGAPVTVVLSFNTNQLRKVNNLFVPVIFNGPTSVTANLYVVGSSTPLASNAIPVVVQNADLMIRPTTFTQVATAGPVSNGGFSWYKGNVSLSGGNYVSFFPVTPTSITWATTGAVTCGSTGNMVTGTPQTGIALAGTATCGSTVENAVNVGGYSVTAGTAPAADVIYIAAAGFTQVGTAFMVAGENRYNPLTAAAPTYSNVYIDNKGPVVTPNPIGFLSGAIAGGDAAPFNCEETALAPGCWVNGSYDLFADFGPVDGGSGNDNATRTLFERNGALVTPCTANGFSLATAAENTSPAAYDVCYQIADRLGNLSSKTAGFNVFGVDKTPPTFTYNGTYDVPGTVNPKVVNAIPALVIDYLITDNNSGIDGTNNVGIKVARTNLLHTGGGTISSTACAVPNTSLNGVAPAPQGLNTPYAPDNACAFPGQYKWSATGWDRAGNSAGPIVRQIEYNPGGSNISLVAAVGNYAPSVAASMNVWADDDEDLVGYGFDYLSADENGNTYWWGFGPWTGGTANVDASPIANYPGIGGFGYAALGMSWDDVLNLTVTQAQLTLPAAWVLRGFTHTSAAISTNQFQNFGAYIFDSWEQRTSAGWYGSYSYQNFAVPAQLRTAYSSTANTWTGTEIANILNAALINPSGRCTLEWTTLTNAPTVIARVWGHDNGLVIRDASGTPTLMTDNGIQRTYRLQLDAVSTCATLQITDVLAIDGDVGLYLIGDSPGGGAIFPAEAAFAVGGESRIRSKNQQ